MSALPLLEGAVQDDAEPDLPDTWLLLSDPDLSDVETQLVQATRSSRRPTAGTRWRTRWD
jgi:hypothetical protein